MQSLATFLGRLFIAAVFLYSGFKQLLDIASAAQKLSAHGIPYAETLSFIMIALQFFGGLSLLLGYKTRMGAILLSIYLVWMATVFNFDLGKTFETTQLFENVAILGGLFYVWSFGPGAWSMDGGKSSSRGSKPKARKD
jgi:uncharacterized membrane protein YphA (DoxX/SURF4 family)